MEDKKYYTPDISEFHVGFKYQYDIRYTYQEGDYTIDDGSNWIDCTFSEPDDTNIWDIDDDIDCGRIRVKYLDSSDIESLGFEPLYEDRSSNIFVLDTSRMNFVYDKLHLEFVNGYVILHNNLSYENYECWFNGKIKNISELKFILKAIGCE